MYIPLNIWSKIDSFLPCNIYSKSVLFSVNKELNTLPRCKIINYKSLICCKKHSSLEMVRAIDILNYHKGKSPSTMHFDSQKILDIVKPYLTDFGVVNHYCCGGKGVVFRNSLI